MCTYIPAGVIVTILFQIVYIHATYILSQNKTTWGSNDCVMASPEVEFDDGDYLIKEHQQLTPEITSAWIGYNEISMGFEYLDCVKTAEIDAIKTFAIKGDPGQCFPDCGNASTIGVSKATCYCLEDNYGEFKSERKCTKECSGLNNVACGYWEQYMSVYRRNVNITKLEQNNAQTQTTRSRNCLRFEPVNRVFQWDSCYFSFHTMCLSGSVKMTGDKFKNWIGSSNVCFGYSSAPVPYMQPFDPVIPDTVQSAFWTGIFRTKVILKSEDISPDLQYQSMKYGFLEYDSEKRKYFLRMTEKNTSRRKTLCDINVQVDSTTVTEARIETTTTIQTEDGKKNSISVTTVTTAGTSEANLTQTKSLETQPKSKDNWIIYVAIGVSLVVIVAVLVIIIMIKRRFNQCCVCLRKNESSVIDAKDGGKDNAYFTVAPHELEPTGNTENVDYNYPDVNISSFSRTGDEADDSSRNYYELETQHAGSKYSKPLRQMADDSTYDTTKSSTTGNQTEGENIYNKLAADDNTYDTTMDKKHQNNSNKDTEDVYNKLNEECADAYDSTVSRRQEVPDEIYDKASPLHDDTYSHVQNCSKTGNKNHTDNVYGDTST